MNFEEFTKEIEKEVRKRTGLPTTLCNRMKNNGIKRRGIVIAVEGRDIAPVISLEEYYNAFEHGMKIESVIEEILDLNATIKVEREFHPDSISDYDSIKGRIIFSIINTQKNVELLKKNPHREIEDLSIVYKILLEESELGDAVISITNEFLENWKVNEEDLWTASEENTKRIFPAEFFTMTSALTELMEERKATENLLTGKKTGIRDRMYVLSNKKRSEGAACLAYPGILETIAGILHRNYYILPSSIHEVIVLPDRGELEVKEINEMVKDINECELDPEDVLSDHCYKYLAEEKKLIIP